MPFKLNLIHRKIKYLELLLIIIRKLLNFFHPNLSVESNLVTEI